jgi:hypothetical protein
MCGIAKLWQWAVIAAFLAKGLRLPVIDAFPAQAKRQNRRERTAQEGLGMALAQGAVFIHFIVSVEFGH